ncbi:hypothetical protein BDZ97DRAFT_1839323 [Flammula alnicola]|nr:hypothetical protein BDZ97DRAFT_1839323 [Flammula alnicola]
MVEGLKLRHAVLTATVVTVVVSSISYKLSIGFVGRLYRQKYLPPDLLVWRELHAIEIYNSVWKTLLPLLKQPELRLWAATVHAQRQYELPDPDNYLRLAGTIWQEFYFVSHLLISHH